MYKSLYKKFVVFSIYNNKVGKIKQTARFSSKTDRNVINITDI